MSKPSPPKPDVSSIELGNTTVADMAKPSDITFGDTQLASPSAQNLELTSLSLS